jgi:hypothetical protein
MNSAALTSFGYDVLVSWGMRGGTGSGDPMGRHIFEIESMPPDQVNLVRAVDLPGQDWWNGLADPYIVVTATTPQGTRVQYRCRPAAALPPPAGTMCTSQPGAGRLGAAQPGLAHSPPIGQPASKERSAALHS